MYFLLENEGTHKNGQWIGLELEWHFVLCSSYTNLAFVHVLMLKYTASYNLQKNKAILSSKLLT